MAKKPLDRDGDGDVDYEDFKAALAEAQAHLDALFERGEKLIKKGGAKVDSVIKKASSAIKENLAVLDQWGRYIGGEKGGPPRKEQDGGRK